MYDLRNLSQNPDKIPEQISALSTLGNVSFAQALQNESLPKVLPEIVQGFTYQLVSYTQWSMHELILHLLDFIGPAEVWLASWAISETPMRELLRLRREGAITNLVGLFDSRIKSQCPAAAQLIHRNLDRLGLTDIHAKVTVICNSKWKISVTGTANLTNKRRIEKYVIDCRPDVAQFDMDWIEKQLKTAHYWN